ncbi:heavy-metal-associated domain-containing protein [Ethanoligenens harbinense]|uniref:Copper chaperone CopZ n=1 Tax=Ethanoligenens harbinense (strain DSM 18485 / JCM 12961 / CGMCC 1.5033 / YUAN-3) TaxID=663278 RepID=E6U3W8_ETHHY|nr:heavy metal-associated domain-containing protein [Ethanoligenens harbinense]ADU26535.1 Heavy metal transport/detoxification protein [Ethanoligenens harbinense YUAN-3]AVQ95661.1 hypothetical protein CXQ68_05090 [Ethanoligenens harbinense YUAN-3]AYF38324.1 hypothetical protein CXP51_04950 [Ethanoligenens harbinense]AYF41069.1 hypothetical protein CN246_05080 [Ethanoligenens harbinense]QCN91900.1 heavy-metal-associated domain-containing protein [Ethanoligenens harbinense]
MNKVTLTIDGMMCMGCKGKVEKALEGLKGVHTYTVDLSNGKASVEYDSSLVTPDVMKVAIEDKGFSVMSVA